MRIGSDSDLQKAVNILNSSGIIIFPTDTAFGIGCRINDEKAVERLFKIRRRPPTKAVPVLVDGLEMAKSYADDVPDLVVEKLIKPYWPGALTIVLQGRIQKIPSLVRGGGSTVGLRMPDNESALNIIKEVGVPILGTSANFAGNPTPYSLEDLDPELVKLVDFVMSGECSLMQASTVIDCTDNDWKVLRQGAVKIGY